MAAPRLEFFYDCSSPWTYIAFCRVIPLMDQLGLPIDWRPILVGGVFNAVNDRLYAAREAMFADDRRRRHYFKDLNDWARLCELQIVQPDVFPVNSVQAMRGALFAATRGQEVAYARAVFAAYWTDNLDISDRSVLLRVAAQAGVDADDLAAALDDDRYRQALRSNTEELIARGGFGSPTLFINGDDMYFGNDRLPLVEHRLRALLAA